MFVYELTVESGHFEIIKESIGGITPDRRLQVLLIAFAFGAVLEGAGGGGAPVAIAGAMMVGLGFNPFAAAVLCLIANTSPVAFGGVGNPIRALVAVTGAARRGPQRHGGPHSAVDRADTAVLAGALHDQTGATRFPYGRRAWCAAASSRRCSSIGRTIRTRRWWTLSAAWPRWWRWRCFSKSGSRRTCGITRTSRRRCIKIRRHKRRQILHAWLPFLLLSVFVIAWGLPRIKRVFDKTTHHRPGAWLAPAGDSRAAGGRQGARRTGGARHRLVLLHRHRDISRGPDFRSDSGPEPGANAAHFPAHLLSHALQHGGDSGDAGSGIRDALFRNGRGAGPGHDPHRRRCCFRFSARCWDGWAWR